jgi:O-antigen/teichoic acid export membrane protein
MQLPHLLSVVLVAAAASYALIPHWGLMGAAWAMGIAAAWQLVSGWALLGVRIGKPSQTEW